GSAPKSVRTVAACASMGAPSWPQVPADSTIRLEERLEPGDLLVLHTGRLARDAEGATERLLALAPRLTAAHGAQECVRTVAEAFGDEPRENDACVLIVRVTGARA
ncbi:hypothetical protein ACWEWX_53560, partial [Streptomyces asiaticus]